MEEKRIYRLGQRRYPESPSSDIRSTRHPVRHLAYAALGAACMLTLAGCPSSGSSKSSVPPTYQSYFVYTANKGSNDVSMFEVDPTGNMNFFGKVPVGASPVNIATNLNYAFVANSGDNTISVFSIQTNGLLVPAGTIPTGTDPRWIDMAAGKDTGSLFVDVVCAGSNQVIEYKLTPGGGATPILTEVARASVGNGANFVQTVERVTDADTHDLYVSNFSDGTVSVLSHTPTGFIPVAKPTLSVPTGPIGSEWMYIDGAQYLRVFSFGTPTVQTYSGSYTAGYTLTNSSPIPRIVGFSPEKYSVSAFGDEFAIATGPNKLLHIDGTKPSAINIVGSTPIVGGNPTAIAQADGIRLWTPTGIFVATDDGFLGSYKWPVNNPGGDVAYFSRVDTHGTMPVSIATSSGSLAYVASTPLVIDTATLANGQVGTAYESHITTAGGRTGQAMTWSVTSGSLPPGLSLTSSGANESLSGNPTTPGTYTFTVQALQGVTIASKTFTVNVTGGTTGPGNVRFINASTVTAYNPIVLKLGSTSFSATSYGSLSGALSIPTGGLSYSLNLPSGAAQLGGSTVVDDPNRNIFVSLGAISADLFLSKFSFASTYPGTTTGGISFMNGIPTRDLPSVDVYIYSGTTLFKRQLSVAYGGVVTCALPPGTYFVKVTEPGNPAAVVANSANQTIAVGDNALDIIVSPESAAATFVQARE